MIVRFLTVDLGGIAIACIRLYIAAFCLGLCLKMRGDTDKERYKKSCILVDNVDCNGYFYFFSFVFERGNDIGYDNRWHVDYHRCQHIKVVIIRVIGW
ncbi:hypothetical protein [uncultured Shewanella sp.]|uniref:hypothetical protein n=1 Tax=uncultured Shewanella sp. TaxID=173975 RepID=UPI0026259DFF|nr:hypothetical protein [uncultured Shewanella sp.]